MMDIDARDFGRLEGDVQSLRDMIVDQNKTLASLQHDLATVNQVLAEAKGGWRTLMWLGGASSAMGAAVGWAVQHLAYRVGS